MLFARQRAFFLRPLLMSSGNFQPKTFGEDLLPVRHLHETCLASSSRTRTQQVTARVPLLRKSSL
jgi:hypothetical protein